MSIKKMFVGEKMPDKNDPKYRERYEREVNYVIPPSSVIVSQSLTSRQQPRLMCQD